MSALDKFLKDKRSELSELKQKRRKLKGTEKAKLNGPISDLDLLISRFMKSKMEPRRVRNIIINYKLLDRFLKKLKGFKTKSTITDNMFLLQYGKDPNNYTGKLELIDLSEYFEGYGEVPEVEILNE